MTHFRLAVVPGQTPEPSRPGRATVSSAPSLLVFIESFHRAGAPAASPRSSLNFKRYGVLVVQQKTTDVNWRFATEDARIKLKRPYTPMDG